MSFASTPSAADNVESSFYESSESQEPQSRFSYIWDDDASQNIGFTDSIYLEGIQEAVNWADSTFLQPTGESPGYIQSNHSTALEAQDIGRICYGMIYQAEVKLSETNMPKLSMKVQHEVQVTATERVLKFKVERKMDHLSIVFSDGVNLGILSEAMLESLGPILERGPDFFLEGVIPTRVLREKVERISKSFERRLQMDINVYGLRDAMKQIGEELSLKKLWLQKPDHYQTRYPYENPHVVTFPGIRHTATGPNDLRRGLDDNQQRDRQDRIQKIVSEVHVSLQRATELETTAGDRRLQTPLLDHQARALTFMKQRESGNIPEKYRLWQKSSYEGQEMYIHRVTKTRSLHPPDENGGGILADEMGMGKSLCILALLLDTLDEGREWALLKHSEEYGSSIKKYSRSTLVIVPSALLINNWLKEVETHLGGSIKYFKYHGAAREKDLDILADSDLIVTTYQTLRSEFFNRKSQLHKIGWYRVVLDEAHVIRRPSNTFYNTCLELEARSRWCLTGTPIQNRLMDIGALFAFLRANPFNDIRQFRRFIVLPFDQGDEVVKQRLVLLYDSLCLRRDKDILDLPGTEDHEEVLIFSPEERKQYDSTSKTLQRSMGEKVGQYEKHKEFGLFQAQLQLRILCNHGTYQKPFSWKRMALHLDESLAVGFGTGFERKCDGCEQLKPPINITTNVCGHFWCTSCMEDLEDQLQPGDCLRCLYKDDAAKHQRNDTVLPRTNHKQHHRDALIRSTYFKDVGISTKMNRVVQDLKGGMDEMKSIVFSCWTYTMDLAGRHLKDAGIDYLRIDGDTLMSKRQQVLDEFDGDSGARVLLRLTTGTGAFGLNIPAARRVFILEPQWNPSVENQAIARTTRLNQKEKVLVTRYRIEGTVETEMLSQQKQKREIAKLGW